MSILSVAKLRIIVLIKLSGHTTPAILMGDLLIPNLSFNMFFSWSPWLGLVAYIRTPIFEWYVV